MVKSGHALPSQSDAGAHLNTNFCTAGESSYVLAEWVRERQLLSLEDAIRRLTFQPASSLGPVWRLGVDVSHEFCQFAMTQELPDCQRLS